MAVRKKSGFQITSVVLSRPASSGSLAEDSEEPEGTDELDGGRAREGGRHSPLPSPLALGFLLNGLAPAGGEGPSPEFVTPSWSQSGTTAHNPEDRSSLFLADHVPGMNLPSPATSRNQLQITTTPSAATPTTFQKSTAVHPPSHPPSSSRFRVVRLDPFRRGRWTCTDFHVGGAAGPLLVSPEQLGGSTATTTIPPTPSAELALGLSSPGFLPLSTSPMLTAQPLLLPVSLPTCSNPAFPLHTLGCEDGSSGASVVAIDNKIEQAMDLVKSHLMYAVREEVELLREQIKDLLERNVHLEQENRLLRRLASPEQLQKLQDTCEVAHCLMSRYFLVCKAGPPPNFGSLILA
uniref:TSC22 domain family protein 1 n=1 Tax=Eptatretus burgeri TaxID=7764 RepID=A0A8C4QYV0_EPTBU